MQSRRVKITDHSDRVEMSYSFNLTVHFRGDGLLGGIHEYDPFLGVHSTFGEYKIQKEVNLQLSNGQQKPKLQNHQKKETFHYDKTVLSYETRQPLQFTLHYDEYTRGDESLWIELWCHSRNSGLREIDAREARYTERHVSCGIFPLDLHTILQKYQETQSSQFNFTQSVVDDKIVQYKLQEYQQEGVKINEQNHREYHARAMAETCKGQMELRVEMRHFDAKLFPQTIFARADMKRTMLHATLPKLLLEKSGASSQDTFTPVLYNSDKGVQSMIHTLEQHVLSPYGRHFLQMERQAPLLKPLNGQISQLQMPMWVSKMGPSPAYAYWSCHDPTTREYPNEELRRRDLELYGFDANTETLLLTMLNASLRREGLSATVFEREIRDHFSPHNKSLQSTPLFRLCEKVIADTGTFAANSASYTADFRFVNQSKGGGGKRKESKMIVLDSWDNTILNGIGNSDDCEGEDNTASTIIRAFATGRHTLNYAWESSLLNACRLYLQYTVIYDVGATVTSAYMDADHKQIDMKKVKDLPMVGDRVDLASECGGHCHGLMEPLSIALKRINNGNTPQDIRDKIQAQFQSLGTEFLTRDATRPTLVLEPTSSIEPEILPLKETRSGEWLNKDKAVRQWHKALRVQLMSRRDKEGKPLAGMVDLSDMVSPEGLPYYVEEQHPQRRVSSFYNEVVHAISLELARFDPILGQMAFCRKIQNEMHYGAKIGDLLRHRTDYALVTPFAECRQEWQEKVRPMIESLQHQLPLMAFGRYNAEQREKICSHYNNMSDINHHYNFTSTPIVASDEAKSFQELIHSVAENPNLAVVRLYSRAWKFHQSAELTMELKKFISESYGVVQHAYYTERHLPGCDPVVVILCINDVKACLKIRDDGTIAK